jgi:hypothetical protein
MLFGVQRLKLAHVPIHSALCALDRSIVLMWYFFNTRKPFRFEANSELNRFNLLGKREHSNTRRQGLWCRLGKFNF